MVPDRWTDYFRRTAVELQSRPGNNGWTDNFRRTAVEPSLDQEITDGEKELVICRSKPNSDGEI